MTKKRVLVISTLGLHYEGITSVIYNYLSHTDTTSISVDFIAYDDINPDLRKKFEGIGKIIIVPTRKKNVMSYIIKLNDILSSNYDVIHIHGNSSTMLIETVIAKIHRVKNILIHCHNTTCAHPIINKMMKFPMKVLANHFLACSYAAGQWLYGKSEFLVLNNAIDLERFTYNEIFRKECRKELNIKDEYLIGHIGHFSEQKNHTFLIDVFNEFHKMVPNSKLMLISDGPKFKEIIAKVSNLGLENDIIFLGRRSNTEILYSAMDIFILPSLWEGLPVVMLEAQANGLPLLVSSRITEEAKCTKHTYYKDITDGANSWAKTILEIKRVTCNHDEDVREELRNHGFDIIKESEKLKQLYLL